MKRLRLTLIFVGLLGTLCSCSSGGKKGKSSPSAASSGTGRSSDGKTSSTAETDSAEGGPAEVAPTKKELYDGIQIALGSSDDAVVEKAVANALSQEQGDSTALNSLALYHQSKGRLQLAKMILNSIVEKNPKESVAWNNLGAIYSQQGEQRRAIEHYRKALAARPGYPIASANLGSILAVGRDYGKATKLLESAYEGGIKDLALLNNYAVALMSSGDSEAEKVFKEAVQIGGTDATVSFNYALYLTYVKKDYKEAADTLDKIRFIGMPASKKAAVASMEETISGSGSVEKETP